MRLFIEDKFSLINPSWKKIKDKSFNKKIISKLPSSLIKYLGKVKSISLLDALEINSNNIMISGYKNTLIIKKFKKKYIKNLENQIFIYNKIKEKKLPCPNILNTNEGYLFKLEDNEIGIALNFIDGKYFNGTKTQLKNTAIAISTCMNELKSIECSNFKINKIFPDNSSEIIEQFMILLSSKSSFSDKEKLFIKKNYNKIISIEYEILKKLYIFDNIDFKMFHRDLHPHNILINKNKVSLIDVESILPTKWPIAYGFAIFKLLRQFCIGKEFNQKNIKLMHDFIDLLFLSSDIDGVNYKILFIGARIEILRRILVIMEGNLNNKISPWNSVMGIQIRALNEVEYIESKLI